MVLIYPDLKIARYIHLPNEKRAEYARLLIKHGDNSIRLLVNYLDESKTRYYAILDGDEVIATIGVVKNACYIRDLAVKPEYRNMGLATILITYILDNVCSPAHMHVRKNNEPMLNLIFNHFNAEIVKEVVREFDNEEMLYISVKQRGSP